MQVENNNSLKNDQGRISEKIGFFEKFKKMESKNISGSLGEADSQTEGNARNQNNNFKNVSVAKDSTQQNHISEASSKSDSKIKATQTEKQNKSGDNIPKFMNQHPLKADSSIIADNILEVNELNPKSACLENIGSNQVSNKKKTK